MTHLKCRIHYFREQKRGIQSPQGSLDFRAGRGSDQWRAQVAPDGKGIQMGAGC